MITSQTEYLLTPATSDLAKETNNWKTKNFLGPDFDKCGKGQTVHIPAIGHQ